MNRRFWICVLVISTSVGCETWTKLPVGEYHNRRRGFSVQLNEEWMKRAGLPYFLMTRDGLVLEYIAVDRHPMGRPLANTKQMFHAGMSLSQIAETDLDDIQSREQVGGFTLMSQKPYAVDGHEAYVFQYVYTNKEGLDIQGLHVGFPYESWVYRIQFEAAGQHYFDQYESEFRVFLNSFKVF